MNKYFKHLFNVKKRLNLDFTILKLISYNEKILKKGMWDWNKNLQMITLTKPEMLELEKLMKELKDNLDKCYE